MRRHALSLALPLLSALLLLACTAASKQAARVAPTTLAGNTARAAVATRPSTPDAPATPAALTRRGDIVRGLIDVGGHRLYLNCTGTGSPAVVMDAGFGDTSATWSLVQPGVAQFTRVCSYDRAGLGKSDPEPGPDAATSLQMMEELHTLLANARIPGPFVLVGHSFGGMNVQLYARHYPTEAAGLVLVDSASEVLYEHWQGITPYRGVDLKASADQVYAAGPLPDVPMIVLVHGQPNLSIGGVSDEQWLQMQRDTASRVPNSKLVIAQQSGHYIQDDQPQLVIDSIRQVVELARKGS